MDCGRRYSNLKPWRIRKLSQVPRPTCWLPQWIANLTKQTSAPCVDQNMKYLCSRFCGVILMQFLGRVEKLLIWRRSKLAFAGKCSRKRWRSSEMLLSDNRWKLFFFKFRKKDIFGRYLEDHELKKLMLDYSITIYSSMQLERTHWYWSTVHFIIYSL